MYHGYNEPFASPVRELPVTTSKGKSLGTVRVRALFTPRGNDNPDTRV
jgi:hypothetical protein